MSAYIQIMRKSVTYLETHVGLLARCNVFSSLSNLNNRDVVVVALETMMSVMEYLL